jgi:GT2 family glycosyltransferase
MLLKGDTYHDRSHAIITPSRGVVHAEVYGAHLSMRQVPGSVKSIRVVVTGDEVGVAYNRAIRTILDYKERFRYIITLEDDMLPPELGFEQLIASIEAHPEMAGVSGLYYTKHENKVPLVLGFPDRPQDGSMRSIPTDDPNAFIECNIIPQGFGIFRADLYRELPFPWYVTTRETQDVTFCRKARDKGYRFAVDCSIRCGHLDLSTGKVY